MKRRLKPGPKAGLYKRLLEEKFKGEYPPIPYAVRKNTREYSRRLGVRRLHKRQQFAKEFQMFAKYVRDIRAYTGKSRRDFAKLIGVSVMSLRRWECAHGCLPAQYRTKNKKGQWVKSTADRLDALGEIVEQLKKSNTPFEG